MNISYIIEAGAGKVRRRIIAALLVVGFLSTPVAATPVSALAELHLSSRSLPQGGAVLLSVRAGGSRVVEVRFAGRRWPAYAVASGLWLTVLGTDPSTRSGTHLVVVRLRRSTGVEFDLATAARVTPGSFRVRRIWFAPPQARLLTAENVEAERRRVRAALRVLHPQPLWDGPFLPPVPGGVASAYGVRSIYQGRAWGFHRGVDLRTTAGEPVRASAAGIVRLAERLPLGGQAVLVDHGLGVVTSYLHLSRVDVRVGQRVAPGQRVGLAGRTGLATGAHLHWGMWVNGVHVDPWPWTRAAPHPWGARGVR